MVARHEFKLKQKKPTCSLRDKHHKAFVDAYLGEANLNASKAGRIAGYKGPIAGYRLLQHPLVIAEIERRTNGDKAKKNGIATKDERLAFLSDIIRGAHYEMRDRIKACELLCRAGGDFIDRHEISGPNGGAIILRAADLSDDELATLAAGKQLPLPAAVLHDETKVIDSTDALHNYATTEPEPEV